MKKALSVFLVMALALAVSAQEPVADVNVAEFTGNAEVKWGVDLDTGHTGFANSTEVKLKLNLLNGGSKSTTGEGVWGELVIKTDSDTFVEWKGASGATADAATGGMGKDLGLKLVVDVAKIHVGPVYIGIKSGDTTTGKLKMDAAIRSADNDNAWTLADVGPANYSNGIVVGYDSDAFSVAADFRSKPDAGYVYTDNYAAALEGELKAVENLSVKAGVSYNFTSGHYANGVPGENGVNPDKDENGAISAMVDHSLGYSASVGYKLGLNDTFYIRPQLGFAGSTSSYDGNNRKISSTSMGMAIGFLFGWGEVMDANAGVYYLDGDGAKKVTPGVGVVVGLPFATTGKTTIGSTTTKSTTYPSWAARIMPSFFSGEIVPGLTAAAYGDIVIPKTGKDKTGTDSVTYSGGEKAVAAMAFALGAKYAITVDELTITPQVGLRFANAAYEDYAGITETTNPGIFHDKDGASLMGDQKEKSAADQAQANDGITSDGNYMNLKLGVDVAGLIDNTTLSVVWATDNILNAKEAANIAFNKLGELNLGAKIAL